MPCDAATAPGEHPWNPNLVPWVSRCRERTPLTLMPQPTHESMREWKADMITKMVMCSDRIEDYVMPWLYRASNMAVSFDELGIVPNAFVKLDRILINSLKDRMDKDGELHRWMVHEGHMRLERMQKPITGPQILRSLVSREGT